MTDTNESEGRSPRLYHPLPELEDSQDLAIAADVEVLLPAVMELVHPTAAQLQWAMERLGGKADAESRLQGKKQFLALLLREHKEAELPEAFFALLMRIGVYEADPSFNRSYIEPCLRAFGYRKVLEALLNYLEHGTNREKAGAARALYWAQLPLLLPSWDDRARSWQNQEELQQALQIFAQERETAKQVFQHMWDTLANLRSQIALTLLKEFIANEDLDVRRSILPQLSLKPSRSPAEWQPLISVAIQLARTHPDNYIRHRVEIQVGEEGDPDGPATSVADAMFQQDP